MSRITKSSRVKSQTMGSFSGTSEIVEVKEDYSSSQKSPMFKQGRISSLEDDINKLFEAINIRTSSKGLNQSNQVGSTLLSKRDSKKPIRASTSTSGIGFSEPTSLKQALRGLCISQASEMASMKRLSKMPGSPALSEPGNITSLYRSVVVAASGSGLPVAEGRVGRLEISLNPKPNTSSSLEKAPQYFGEPKLKSTNHSANSSPQFAPGMTSKSTNHSANSSPKFASGMTSKENTECSMATSTDVRKQSAEVEPVQEDFNTEVVSLPCLTTKDEVLKEGRNMSASIEPIILEKNSDKNISVPSKVTNKAVLRLRRKGKVQIVPSSSSTISNKLSKSIKSGPRAIKPSVVRDKSSVKKKTRLVSTSAPDDTIAVTDINCDSDPSTSILICKKCQCSLKGPKESDDSSLEAQSVISLGSSSIISHNASSKPSSSLNGCTAVGKSYKYPSSREKGEFSQSSSSIGEFSSSTSLSEDSNLSGASFSNRPHMSKDLRWEAIQHVTKQHGFLGLGHFTLLKKLGGGDIGTVYLAELIGTNCQFAIKVMDNEFLAKRKKMPRAQTEREILRILDHPFLPTLYAQFISDNLSCLVMEYCPGGDLHVLRQKHPCRYFVEQAARFYVAEVLLALEYLHMLGIVYRDLKPENIMVREDGHIMLTDFDLSLRCSVNPMLLKSSSLATEPPRVSGPCAGSGCIDPFCMKPSCQVSCFTPRLGHVSTKTRKTKADLATPIRSLPLLVAEPTDARSNSFVGTHEYLAPEIIKGEGHGSAVDWWTFGVLLYELLYGKTPFKGLGNEETLANVVLQSLVFPDTPIVSFQARDLIRSLLMKEPENRLGFERGAAEIKQHPFFEGLNWALIRCTIPPQIPSSGEIIASYGTGTKYLEYGTSGEHLEFELF